ncbi:MAG: DUF2795 domain-containing protein [Desulfovibrionales bacterium]
MERRLPVDRVLKTIRGVEYPVLKRDLIKYAKSKNADPEVLQAMEDYLPDWEYKDSVELEEVYVQPHLYGAD